MGTAQWLAQEHYQGCLCECGKQHIFRGSEGVEQGPGSEREKGGKWQMPCPERTYPKGPGGRVVFDELCGKETDPGTTSFFLPALVCGGGGEVKVVGLCEYQGYLSLHTTFGFSGRFACVGLWAEKERL